MSLPIVPLDSIPSHGLDVPVQVWAASRAAEALEGPLSSLGGSLHVVRVGGDIGVAGTVSAEADVPCDRCGAQARLSVTADVSCLYAAPRGVDEAEPETDYDEVGDYDGAALDLSHVVGESLALERPARVLCADMDPAADAACLARWRAAAGQGDPAPDPRLAALRNLSFPSKE